jgi:hypothetical protein
MMDNDNHIWGGVNAEPQNDATGENCESRGEKLFPEAHDKHREIEDLGECFFQYEEEGGTLADESQASILQNQTNQNTQILGLGDLFLQGNSMMGNSQLAQISLVGHVATVATHHIT